VSVPAAPQQLDYKNGGGAGNSSGGASSSSSSSIFSSETRSGGKKRGGKRNSGTRMLSAEAERAGGPIHRPSNNAEAEYLTKNGIVLVSYSEIV
jgi:hypothetical protein